MRLGELAGYIQETMESYEVEVNGKTLAGKLLARNAIRKLKLSSSSETDREP